MCLILQKNYFTTYLDLFLLPTRFNTFKSTPFFKSLLAVADDNGSVYRFFKAVPSNLIPVEITITCDAIADVTDFDLGIYKVGVDGAAVEPDVLMDGQTLGSALTRATGHQLGLKDVNVANIGKTLAELSGQTAPDASYDICLTGNAVGTAAGTVSIIAKFAQG